VPRFIKTRLSFMMFMQYFVMGSTIPIMSLYLKDNLHFSGTQIAIVLAMSSIVAFISPAIGAMVADRLISAERLLTVCHLISAAAMTLLVFQRQFAYVVVTYLAFTLARGPTVALTNAITFHHNPDGTQRFGNIRVWGTIGWIVVALGFGYVWLHNSGRGTVGDRLPDALKLSAISSVILALYALALPQACSLKRDAPVRIIPRESLAVFGQPKILLVAVLSLTVAVVDHYYYFGMAPFMRHIGFSDAAIMPMMSIGQGAEVVTMALLGLILAHIGFKAALTLGIIAEIWRFVALALGGSQSLLISGICCHGMAYALFFTTIYIYIDSYCDKLSRTGLHQLFSIITWGCGSLCGYLMAGQTLDRFVTHADVPSYRSYWLVPACISLLSLVIVALAFRDMKPPACDDARQ
jgi:MFS transporter, NHS family, xanthosine permease